MSTNVMPFPPSWHAGPPDPQEPGPCECGDFLEDHDPGGDAWPGEGACDQPDCDCPVYAEAAPVAAELAAEAKAEARAEARWGL